MVTLADLKDTYTTSTVDGSLILTAENCGVPALAGFLAELPDEHLVLAAPDIKLATGTLTVTAGTTDVWSIGGGAQVLTLATVRLTVTGAAADTAALHLTGTVQVGGSTVSVVGDLAADGRVVFALDGTAGGASLGAIAGFVGDGAIGDESLPVGDLFSSVPLSALRLVPAFGAGKLTEVAATMDLTGRTWPLIDGLADLHDIGVTLTMSTGLVAGRRSTRYGGDIHATLRFDGIDVTARLALRGSDDWRLELVPRDGNLLPGFASLAKFAGGTELATTVQAGFDKLGLTQLSVDAAWIDFGMAAKTVRAVGAATHFTIDGITFLVTVAMPDFQILGSLKRDTPIHLKALVGKYFRGADTFPEIDITMLDVSAAPSTGRYHFGTRISTEWTLDVGPLPFTFTDFVLDIDKDATGVTGEVEAVFTLFDAEFEAVAAHPTSGDGWQFSCETTGHHALTVAAIHAHLVELYHVEANLPAALEGLAIDTMRIFFDTGTGTVEFRCAARFPIAELDADISVDIRVEKDGTGWRKTFGGKLTVGDLDFELHFAQDKAVTVFLATYYHTGAARSIAVRDLVSAASSTVGDLVPADLSIDLRDVVLVLVPNGFAFGFDLGVDLGLSHLPLVGQQFPADRSIGVDSLRVLVALRALTADELAAANRLLPTQVPALPSVAKGLTIAARLNLGDTATKELALPIAPNGAVGTTDTSTTAKPDDAKWFDVQRSFGPVYFERIGFAYTDHQARFLLDAALALSGLTLSLDGLTLGSPIDHFEPSFDLRGIGVDYSNGPVEIGGALLRSGDEYDGAAIIRTESFSLAALGGYLQLNGEPSMFVYAVLDKTLGGPPFFTVTGLAAGFGYNRRLIMPPIEKVADFPLITAAAKPESVTGAANPRELLRGKLNDLRTWIPPTAGDVFLALGVRFTSFQMIDSFALLVANFGQRFELDMLGLSTMLVPRPDASERAVSPLAEIQLAVRGSFVPDEGVLSLRAQLTSASFVFSRDCHITGGFAFTNWFSGQHAGDFVLTVGGYHPDFPVPAHYPQVPRLGLNWQVDGNLAIKADAYLALTPSALMAGGHLQVVWHSGDLQAVFNTGVDFLIAWKPYHYDARAYVDFNVSYTFQFFGTHHINVDIGADLHIWGPDFAGTARINLWIISFDVAFGAQDQHPPAAISWPVFRNSFLPAGDLVAVSVGGGLLRKTTDAATDLGVVDPQRLVLRADTVVPSTGASIRGDLALGMLFQATDGSLQPFLVDTGAAKQQPTGKHTALAAAAVGPMQITLPDKSGVHLVSKVTISITRGGQPMEHHFAFTPKLTNLPAGLWATLSPTLVPDPHAPTVVQDLLGGFEVRPRLDPITGTDRVVVDGVELLQYHLPALPAGTYTFTVTQDVTTSEPEATVKPENRKIPPQQFTRSGDFTVSGVRPTVEDADIYAVYPPDGGTADYTADLPHVILNHSTLPWQVLDGVPWLAVLIFEVAGAPAPRTATVDGLTATVIDVPADLRPNPATLPLLAHVRRAADGTERAVVIGNRLPKPGAVHVAHLVSVTATTGPMVTLKSWRFTSTTTEPGLAGLLRRLADGKAPLRPPAPLLYLAADGPRPAVAYQGPLAATRLTDRPKLPGATATLPIPLATAWQLGRLLALQSKPFAAALYRWKRQRAQRRKSGDTTLPPVPAAVTDWLDDLAGLEGVPFNYLVPDASLAPDESLRFFTVYDGWLAALLDGALSLGRTTPSDAVLDRTLATDLRPHVKPWTAHVLVPAGLVRSGFLLRSHAVAGWPDLRVTSLGGNAAPVRTTLLSANTVLVQFDGDITGVTISQPAQTLHFTLGAAASTWQTGNRVVDIAVLARDRIGAEAVAKGASATFASRMLATASTITINRG